ncbi:hypothetical protein [Faecalibacterium prausnitzii]|jgi:hypothetical protein|uniref:hypothetical protein n=1 Tax=Faecalibacterium prausnitzii TaxID=853 RepID=UPI0022E43132|nr:hypothetical protein [Faecalibacterium prausnitzii]
MTTKMKNKLSLAIGFGGAVGATYALFRCPYFDVSKFLKCNEDFHYNAISMSATIGGFLFTGISILISTIDKDRIKRLWNYNYLDNMYYAAFIGITQNVISIIAALAMILLDIGEQAQIVLVKVEIGTIIIGIVFFIWSVKQMIFVISRLKENRK